MKIIKLLPIFLLLASVNIAALEIRSNYNWKVIGEIEGRVTSIDLNNIEESEGKKVIFVRFSRPSSNEIEKSFYRKYFINCNSSEFTTAASISFDGSDLTGKIVNNIDPLSNLNWIKSKSGTVGSTYIEIACNSSVKINKSEFPLNDNLSKSQQTTINNNKLSSKSKSFIFEKLFMDSFGQERGVQTVKRIATDLCFLDEINKRYASGEDQNAILRYNFTSVDNPKYWSNHKNNALISLNNYKITISELSKIIGWSSDDLIREIIGTQRSNFAFDCQNSNAPAKLGVLLATHLFTNLQGAGIYQYIQHFGMPDIDQFTGDNIFVHYFTWRDKNLQTSYSKILIQAKEETEKRLVAEEIVELKRISDEEKRRQWLTTSEGKKYLLDEEIKRKKLQDDREKAEVAEKIKLAKEFPFYAIISCGIGTGHMTITACFSGDYGSLEIRNGNDYGLYKIVQVANRMIPNSKEQREGLLVNLRSNFEINARNGEDKNIILGVKIIQRNSGNIVFQKQVDNFGTIRIKN